MNNPIFRGKFALNAEKKEEKRPRVRKHLGRHLEKNKGALPVREGRRSLVRKE